MAAVLLTGCYLLLAGTVWSHCDTTGGPVIPEAKAALEKGDVTPILKWVKKENELEIKSAFAKAIAVRARGPEAKELADQYSIENLVRLHRAGEGAPLHWNQRRASRADCRHGRQGACRGFG
jgi:hypothetical protein